MKTTDIKGLPAINAADGDKIGQVERAYFHPVERRIVGFAVGTGAHLFAPESSRLIDVGEVQALGHDSLTLADARTPRGEETTTRYGELVDLDDLTRRQVYTEGGTFVGTIASADFDHTRYGLTSIEAGGGFLKHGTEIPIDQVVTIGPELVVVRNEVCAATATGGDTAPASDEQSTAKTNPAA